MPIATWVVEFTHIFVVFENEVTAESVALNSGLKIYDPANPNLLLRRKLPVGGVLAA
jgi:hypothetical protein